MKGPSRAAARARHIVCPFCETGEIVPLGPDFARCGSCGLPLVGSTLETLREIVGLPDAPGAHPCECGHPEMRRLPDGVFHCPACRSEVLPVEKPSDPESTTGLGSASAWDTGGGSHLGADTSSRNHGRRR